MPSPTTIHLATLVPVGSDVAEATSTTAIALTLPGGCRCVEVTGATVKHYVAVGSETAAPDLSGANAGVVQAGATMTLWPNKSHHTRLYVEAVTGTGTVDVTYYR